MLINIDFRLIDLATASHEELDKLEKACEPATFGLNDKDVYDEAYRKAGKLNVEDFMLHFNAERAGLIEAARTLLFPGQEEKVVVRAELYKLNLYGKLVTSRTTLVGRQQSSHLGRGAFFKAHKDTPRSKNMFGSLVVVFPTAHEGGTLLLRQDSREWTFDSAAILSRAQQAQPLGDGAAVPRSAAFIAFFSDVEHEVTPVLSGHRVTITYNLYFAKPTNAPIIPRVVPAGLSILEPAGASATRVSEALSALLADPTVLPDSGTIGFCLRHQYPLPRSWTPGDVNPLRQLSGWLKGTDAALFAACQAQGLEPYLRIIYELDDDSVTLPFSFERPFLLEADAAGSDDGDHYAVILHKMHKGVLVFYKPLGRKFTAREKRRLYVKERHCTQGYGRSYRWDSEKVPVTTVHMVTEVTRSNRFKSSKVVHYGNEADGIECLYQYISLMVDVGPVGERGSGKTFDEGRWALRDNPHDGQGSSGGEDWTMSTSCYGGAYDDDSEEDQS